MLQAVVANTIELLQPLAFHAYLLEACDRSSLTGDCIIQQFIKSKGESHGTPTLTLTLTLTLILTQH